MHTYVHVYIHTLCVKITCPKSRVLLSRFAASITRIHCARTRTTVEDHGCTGKGRHATRTSTQRFSRPMPLLLLYRAPSFGCSSFFVHRGLCKNRLIDMRGRTQCLHVNLYGPQLLYSARIFGQVFLTRTVCAYICVCTYVHTYVKRAIIRTHCTYVGPPDAPANLVTRVTYDRLISVPSVLVGFSSWMAPSNAVQSTKYNLTVTITTTTRTVVMESGATTEEETSRVVYNEQTNSTMASYMFQLESSVGGGVADNNNDSGRFYLYHVLRASVFALNCNALFRSSSPATEKLSLLFLQPDPEDDGMYVCMYVCTYVRTYVCM